MPIDTIKFGGKTYLALQQEGNATRWVKEFALRLCHGKGYDIGFSRPEWSLGNGAIPIDLNEFGLNGYNAMKLPDAQVDYIFASQVIEHVPSWVEAAEYWKSMLKVGGVLFIYTYHPDGNSYWLPFNDRKHIHAIYPQTLVACLERFGFINIFASGMDLNASYCVVAEKKAL